MTTPVGTGISVDDTSPVTITANVRTTNEPSSFNRFYIPLTLHLEADASREITLGVKGGANLVPVRGEIAPRALLFAMATVRYNF